MARRLFLSRLSFFHLLRPNQQSLIPHSNRNGSSSLSSLPSTETLFGICRHIQVSTAKRGIQTLASLASEANGNTENHEKDPDDPEVVSDSIEMIKSNGKDGSVNYTAASNLKTSKRHDLAMIFTCKVCETRSVKTVCRESYDKGVVVVRCGGCNNFHLIADRLGWFGEPGSVEELLAARGEEVKKGSLDSLNLTVEDLAGARS